MPHCHVVEALRPYAGCHGLPTTSFLEQTDLLQQVMGSLPGGTTLPDLLDALEKNEALASWATALRSQTTA